MIRVYNGASLRLGLILTGLTTGLLILGKIPSALAQIIPDGTTATNVKINGNNLEILDGLNQGKNLFHSFSNFSVNNGQTAIFDLKNTPDITTIFSRVTGSNLSNIDGVIRTLNSNNPVSLFLMNPNGIVFGSSAKLDISGSFVGTTASSIKFANGTEFSAVDTKPLLTMSVPIGLQMNGNPGAITVKSIGHQLNTFRTFVPVSQAGKQTGLQVPSGKTLTLVGGDIFLEGGVLTASQGRVELGAVDTGLIKLNADSQGWNLNYEDVAQFRHLNLSQKSLVDVSGIQAGKIQLQAAQLKITDGSVVLSQNSGNLPSGNISIRATETLQLAGESNNSVASTVSTENLGSGKAADIQITTSQLQMTNGATIAARSFGSGTSGNINVNAQKLDLYGTSQRNPVLRTSIFTVTYGVGLGGDIKILTDQIYLTGGAFISSSTFGKGTGGSVFINATDSVQIQGFEPILTSPSVIGTATYSSGTSGDVNLETQRLRIQGGGRLDASTYASGMAGNIQIRATDFIEVTGGNLKVNNPSIINASAFSLIPAIRNLLRLPDIPTGDAANISIQTPTLSVTDNGIISVRNDGLGQAGNVKIQSNLITLNRQGSIVATTKSGQGGEIFLDTRALILNNNSLIAATAQGIGNGGNIQIDAPVILGLNNSDIVANAVKGYGGNIVINTRSIFGLQFSPVLTPGNNITASSELGLNGTVQINNIGLDPNSGLVELPANVTDSSQQIVSGCSNSNSSSFVAIGRGGIPQNPTQEIKSDRPWSDVRDLTAFHSTKPAQAQIPQSPETLIQATSWRRNAQGKIELVADQFPLQVQTTLTCATTPQN